MITGFTILTLFILCATDVSQSVLITQWPDYISSLPGGSAEMHCYQNDTDYNYLYWYRQQRGKAFQLIVYIVAGNPNYEEEFKSGFQAVSLKKKWSLTIQSLQGEDEAVYLCAASQSLCSYGEAHFGAGTKLTVLEPGINVTAPTVRVLKPCKSQKGNKTLVCVASGFYPDHVSVSWEIDDVVVNKKRVATDNAAVREDKYYNITSLLRVSEEEWYTEGKKFHCAVRFYDGSDYIYRNKTVLGKQKVLMNTEQYLATTRIATISYSVVIAKSCIYGAFVAVLVWKLQGSAGKQDD
ncbi:M1-specific T cell receptor beta chain-like [Acanthopagrus latus]|uniref:M1-specific T cell receptor beta chain-like n=1 Tax=Acanthopagrus latus TaxID=8177 RepID=UPI00187C1E39|nr:M1-specific T cell receptor beta chain-like [Acanthopagrus latus]